MERKREGREEGGREGGRDVLDVDPPEASVHSFRHLSGLQG